MVVRTMLTRMLGCHTNSQLVAGFIIDLAMWQNCNTNWFLISAIYYCIQCTQCIVPCAIEHILQHNISRAAARVWSRLHHARVLGMMM